MYTKYNYTYMCKSTYVHKYLLQLYLYVYLQVYEYLNNFYYLYIIILQNCINTNIGTIIPLYVFEYDYYTSIHVSYTYKSK